MSYGYREGKITIIRFCLPMFLLWCRLFQSIVFLASRTIKPLSMGAITLTFLVACSKVSLIFSLVLMFVPFSYYHVDYSCSTLKPS